MFNSGVIAAAGVTSGYSATLEVGTAGDKFGTRYGFLSNGNSSPPFQQQGSGTATIVQFGNLDNDFVNLGGVAHRINGISFFGDRTSVQLLHPNQSDTTALPVDTFSSITIGSTTLNTNNLLSHSTQTSWNAGYRVTFWSWFGNPLGVVAGVEHTIIIEE